MLKIPKHILANELSMKNPIRVMWDTNQGFISVTGKINGYKQFYKGKMLGLIIFYIWGMMLTHIKNKPLDQ